MNDNSKLKNATTLFALFAVFSSNVLHGAVKVLSILGILMAWAALSTIIENGGLSRSSTLWKYLAHAGGATAFLLIIERLILYMK